MLAEIRRREAALLVEREGGMTLADVWDWVSAKEREPFLRVFFAAYVDAMSHPQAHVEGGRPMVGDWLEFLGSRWRPGPLDAATATLFIAVIRGLLLDRLTAPDPERTDRALAQFVALIETED